MEQEDAKDPEEEEGEEGEAEQEEQEDTKDDKDEAEAEAEEAGRDTTLEEPGSSVAPIGSSWTGDEGSDAEGCGVAGGVR